MFLCVTVQLQATVITKSRFYAPIIFLPEGGNPGQTLGNLGECKIYRDSWACLSTPFYELYHAYFVRGQVYTLVGLIYISVVKFRTNGFPIYLSIKE